jgi:hypothetical protein
MLHAMIGGFVGLLLSTLGAVATWNRGPAFGPHWYPVSLIVSALPTAWIGAMIRLAHLRCPAAPRRAQVPAQSPDWAPHLGSKYRREQNPLHPSLPPSIGPNPRPRVILGASSPSDDLGSYQGGA